MQTPARMSMNLFKEKNIISTSDTYPAQQKKSDPHSNLKPRFLVRRRSRHFGPAPQELDVHCKPLINNPPPLTGDHNRGVIATASQFRLKELGPILAPGRCWWAAQHTHIHTPLPADRQRRLPAHSFMGPPTTPYTT